MLKKHPRIPLSEFDARQLLLSPPDGDFVAALRLVLQSYRGGGWLTINQIADLASVSVRTLQRRLSVMELSYSAVVDEVRAEMAIEMLQDKNASLREIAAELGYSTPANFSRSFRRWTGKTPVEIRSG